MFSKLLILLGLLTGALYAQITPNQVSSGPLANLPQFCSLNDLYFATDQPADNNSFYCASQNNWVLVSAAVTGIDLTVHNLIVTGTFTGVFSGNSATATALQNVPTVCSGGNKPSGVDVHGNATGCSAGTAAAGGSNGDIQINVSGSLGGLTAPAGFLVGTTATQTIQHKTFDATNVFPSLPYDPSGAAATAQSNAITAAEAFSANAANVTSGVFGAARIPTAISITGNAATASLASQANVLSTTPSLCNAGNAPLGVLNSGWVTGCTPTKSCPSILDYGGVGNGATSNNAAWTAALAVSGAQKCVEFPAGTWFFATSPSWTAASASDSITVRGLGADVSRLSFPSGQNGLVLNLVSTSNAVNVTGLSFLTASTAAGVSGLIVNNSGTTMAENVMSNITNNAFYGADCKACTNYWTTSILLNSVIAFNVNYNKFVGTAGTPNGTAISLQKTTAAIPVVFNLVGNTFDLDGLGIVIGDFVQGVTIALNNFTGVAKGVSVAAGFTYGDNDELFIGPSNQFNAVVAGIDIESPIRHTNVFDNYFVVGGAANCALFNNYAMTTVSGNHAINISGGGGNCFVFQTYANDASLIYGNQTQFFTTAIWLQTASAHTNSFMNVGTSNTNNTVNTGTANAVSLEAFTGATTASFQVVDGIVIHQ